MGLCILANHLMETVRLSGADIRFLKEVVWYSSLFLSIRVLVLYFPSLHGAMSLACVFSKTTRVERQSFRLLARDFLRCSVVVFLSTCYCTLPTRQAGWRSKLVWDK